MSESEGLAKLTEYLKQTRRQAEIAIDNLNSQLAEVQRENEALRSSVVTLQKEKELHISTIQQLKTDSGPKSKFKERDEWKALVENIQKDRDRIQQEYNSAVSQLEEANLELARTKQDIFLLTEELHNVTASNQFLQHHLQLQQQQSQGVRSSSPIAPQSPSHESKQLSMMSPVLDRYGRSIFDADDTLLSPHSAAQKLKQELRRSNEQATEELAMAEREIMLKDMEIQRLANELREQQIRQNFHTDSQQLQQPNVMLLAETVEMQRREEGVLEMLLSFFSSSRTAINEVESTDVQKRVLKV